MDEYPFPDARAIGLDIETTGIEFWNPEHEIVLITLSDGDDVLSLTQDDWNDTTTFGNWLQEQVYDRIIITHNSAFDLPWLDYTFGCGIPDRIFDTMIAEQLLSSGLFDAL